MTEEHPPADTVPQFSHEDIRRALQQVEHEAVGHSADYAAGMREAQRILRLELLADE